jgi:hypothetical protein
VADQSARSDARSSNDASASSNPQRAFAATATVVASPSN